VIRSGRLDDLTFSLGIADSVGEWLNKVAHHRGGAALLNEIAPNGTDQWLTSTIASAECWQLRVREEVVGFAILRNEVLLAIHVAESFQRRGIATDFIQSLRRDGVAIVDGYALPGDRATKSLYESIGWKARLLTMRG